ncbi:LOW QUALITY PROTEIN: hypothetical protein PHMEG_00011452 [Phytophthora megakarya]|uniref:Uncharacterized protein n=1 Tax=Phytophthora megakarya TaxID=4795 RepID=A0A225WD95_9STRA|nr:LOW QUALITY PROTEIN: hypothetical protein PHMEG_00011452 [Phytophthora megakarya]
MFCEQILTYNSLGIHMVLLRAYVSKAEPDTLRFRSVIAKAIKRCDSNFPYHSILKCVANDTLSVREVGAPEAIYILLRSLPMHSKSCTVVKCYPTTSVFIE